jgi:putative ABC transport system ATP-binding protein
MALLKSTGLCKSYEKKHRLVHALKDCSIEINAGECVAVSGGRDSGKTTLLRLLSGLERPTQGSVYINQKNIFSYKEDELAMVRRKEIGFSLQNDSLIPELTVHENVILPSLLAGIKFDEGYYKELADHLHISGILSLNPKYLSDRQLQCVALARALINQPNIIMLDEPAIYLYQQFDKEILDFLMNMVYLNKKTLILVTNDTDINLYVDHIITLKQGEVIEDKRI